MSNTGDATDITLYFGLRDGSHISLSAAAKTALAFERVVTNVAHSVDPDISIQVQLIQGEEGSLKLRSRLKTLGHPKVRKQLTDAAITGSVIWLLSETASYQYQDFLDKIFAPEETVTFSVEDKEALYSLVLDATNEDEGQNAAAEVFQFVEEDQSIESIGVTTRPDGVPPNPVPRERFLQRSVTTKSVVEKAEMRTQHSVEDVVLISPVLERKPRRWKLRDQHHTFGALMADTRFLTKVVLGQFPIKMMGGINMRVSLQTKSVLEHGVWVVKEHIVEKVLKVSEAPFQEPLPFEEEPDDDELDQFYEDGFEEAPAEDEIEDGDPA